MRTDFLCDCDQNQPMEKLNNLLHHDTLLCVQFVSSALWQCFSVLICSSQDNLNWPTVMIQTLDPYHLVNALPLN